MVDVLRINTRNLLVSRTGTPPVPWGRPMTQYENVGRPGRITLRRPTVRFHGAAAHDVRIQLTSTNTVGAGNADVVGSNPHPFAVLVRRVLSQVGGMVPWRIDIETPQGWEVWTIGPTGNLEQGQREQGQSFHANTLVGVYSKRWGSGTGPYRALSGGSAVLAPRGRYRVSFTNRSGRRDFFHGQILGRRA